MKEISDELAKGKKLGDEVEGGILVGIKGTGKTADGSAFVKALGESAQTSETFAKELIDERNRNGNFANTRSIEQRMEKYYLDKGYSKNSDKFDNLYDQIDIIKAKLRLPNLELRP
ncbi:hypothetical protein ACFQO9_19965 [Chryseobacterium zhengzhouense]|uniref:Uncharacterized protein n=1 Tax=Chryseobacterium zhengzhouense TaxID=1636086 RepID=A0ABW2M5H7_9FLAO